jgi:uncharacterized phage protein (TIGR02218 family)
VRWYEEQLTTLAFCWRLDRRDGVTIGLTSHDRTLAIGGIDYQAMPGMLPSAVAMASGWEPATTDVAGALTHKLIRDADLTAGRWDGAAALLFACDWSDPAATVLPLTRGTIGSVRVEDQRFTATLLGAAAALDQPVVEQTSPECRATLGDRRCRVDLAGRTTVARVLAMPEEDMLLLDTAEPVPDGWRYGRLRWLDGANAGLSSTIAASAADRIRLRRPPPGQPAPGTRVELREGCDRRFATCRDRFANAANFRGEPYLPGTDLLARFPGT